MLVSLNTSGKRPPLFVVHDQYGTVPVGKDLARVLGPDQPLYVVHVDGVDGRQAPFPDFPGMVLGYIAEIHGARPFGPILIGGIGTGSFAAIEIARELETRGRQVGPVILVDPPRLHGGLPLHQDQAADPAPRAAIAGELYHRVRTILLQRASLEGTCPFESSDSPRVHLATLAGVGSLRAFGNYRPQAFPGTAEVLLPAETAEEFFDHKKIWLELLPGQVITHVLPWDHSALLEAGRETALGALQLLVEEAVEALLGHALHAHVEGPTRGRSVSTHAHDHVTSSQSHDHDHGTSGHSHDHCVPGNQWNTHPELPHARLFPADMQALSWHQPLNNPVWTDAYEHLRDDDPVIGLYLNGQARALPWWIMKNHHVANLALDDLPVLVTLCEMCTGSSAFRAELQGRRLMFRLRGVYNGTILLVEDSTQTMWSPFTGVALAGAMRGTVLERLPLSQCLWSEWLRMHPTSLVLYGEQSEREGHGSSYSPGSPGVDPIFVATLAKPIDRRLPHNTLVLGVENGGKARAYPLRTLAAIGPVLNDSLGGAEIVVRSRPGTFQALAFDRRVGDRVLVFGCTETGDVYDHETGSLWNAMGEAVSGPLAGTQLVYVNSGVEEWYIFAGNYPHTEIFGPISSANEDRQRVSEPQRAADAPRAGDACPAN